MKLNVFIFIFALFTKISGELIWTAQENYNDIKVSYNSAPVLVDIDADGDLDLVLSQYDKRILVYINRGNKKKFQLSKKPDEFSIEPETILTKIAFADLDHDGDLEVYLGMVDGYIHRFDNLGKPGESMFMDDGNLTTIDGREIDVGDNAVPFFVDIDADKDMDLFVGERDGYLSYYENTGTPKHPLFKPVNDAFSSKESYMGFKGGEMTAPFFIDFDKDGDYDLFVGNSYGNIYYFENIGTRKEANFKQVYDTLPGILIGGDTVITGFDLNNDGKTELLSGSTIGDITYLYYKEKKEEVSLEEIEEIEDIKLTELDQTNLLMLFEKNLKEQFLERYNNESKGTNYIERTHLAKILCNKFNIDDKKIKRYAQRQGQYAVDGLLDSTIGSSEIYSSYYDEVRNFVFNYINGNYDKAIIQSRKVLSDIPDILFIQYCYKKARFYKDYFERVDKAEQLLQEGGAARQLGDALGERDAIFSAYLLLQDDPYLKRLYKGFDEKYSSQDNKEYAESVKAQAELFMLSEEYSKAAEEYEKILYLVNNPTEIKKKIAEAKALARKKASEMSKEQKQALIKKTWSEASVAEKAERLKEAQLLYEKLLRIDRSNRLKIKSKIADLKKRIFLRDLAPSIKRQIEAYLEDARVKWSMGKIDEAYDIWRKILELNPYQEEAKKNAELARRKLNQ